jgi:hypothetical protein
MMIFYRHIPIITDHIDTIFFNLARGKIPVTWITDIRFFYLLAVDKKSPAAKFNLVTLSGDHTLQKHDFAPCKAHGYHIMPFRL